MKKKFISKIENSTDEIKEKKEVSHIKNKYKKLKINHKAPN
jgi:hypothetical protein